MKEIQVTMTELRQNLGSLVNQAAYGDNLVVLVSHGMAKAAIIGVEDLRRLKQAYAYLNTQKDLFTTALATADHLRERIRRWQAEHNVEPEDSTETLRQLREENESGPNGLH